jgi:(p)ppGpp synthase/HD superfamily hydrolase
MEITHIRPRFRKQNMQSRKRRLILIEALKIDDNPKKTELALRYCVHYHAGQFRKGNREPYHTHPIAVAGLLARYGYNDPVTQCIAYLHDTIEDSPLRMDELTDAFGYEISNGVYILSRNKGKIISGKKLSDADYKVRLGFARNKIKRVKIADMIVNTRDIEILNPTGIERKINDSETFYIPMGKEICPIMVSELEMNIARYKGKFILKQNIN